MKSPAKMGESRFLGKMSSSSIRNLLPRSIYPPKQKSIQTKNLRFDDENSPPNIQSALHSPHKVSPSAVIQIELTLVLERKPNTCSEDKENNIGSVSPSKLEDRTRSNSLSNEITEEDGDHLGDQIRELKEELIRTKSDGTKIGGYFARESLSQLRMSINKSSLVMSCEVLEKETMYDDTHDVMELSKHVDKFHTYCDDDDLRDSMHSSFASASSCCEADSVSGDDICSEDVVEIHKDCAFPESVAGSGLSISSLPPHQTPRVVFEEPTLSESPKIRSFRKSVASHRNNVTDSSNIGNKDVEQVGVGFLLDGGDPLGLVGDNQTKKVGQRFTQGQGNSISAPKPSAAPCALFSPTVGPSPYKKKKPPLSPTDSLAESLQRGIQIIDSHQRNSLLNRSSVSFSFGHLSLKTSDDAESLSASVKSLREDRPKEGGSSILLCLSCKQKLDHEAEGGYKAIEEACTDEKHLKNMCEEQATKIEQLTCLLDQYKKNNVQEPSKLMKSDDGGDETEAVKETYETNQLSEESGKIKTDLNDKEALLKEIAELKRKLQPTKSTDNMRSSLLLRSFQMRKSTDLTKHVENNHDVLEEERERWTEMESEWINLTDDLRMDIDSHRRHAEDLEIELKKEKMATDELNDALSRAMLGHSKFVEQYTELQEKYDELAERHEVTMAGIVDVKKAAAKAAVKGRHGKHFAKAFSAELTAIRAEKEKEREFLKKENKGLKIQLRDTAEAVQAAGELLVRLREAEQYVQSSEERFRSIEEENEKLKMQTEKLKSKHTTEMSTMKQYLAESKLPESALEPWFKDNDEHLSSEHRTGLVKENEEHESEQRTGVVSYDDYADDQAWRAEFGAIYQDHQY